MRVTCTIDIRKSGTGSVDVMLERTVRSNSHGSSLARELFTLPDSPATDLLLTHLKRLAVQ